MIFRLMYSHNNESFHHGYLNKTVTETQPLANMNMNIVKIEVLSTTCYPNTTALCLTYHPCHYHYTILYQLLYD